MGRHRATVADVTAQKPRVYLAASAAEIHRARQCRAFLVEGGVEVLASWIENVAAVGSSNPRDATKRDRHRWSVSDLTELSSADLVWMLAPSIGHETRGAWVEVGFAFGIAKQLVFSGDTKQSIFCSLGLEYDSDAEACSAILGMLGVGAVAS